MAILIKADGTEVPITPKGECFRLEELYPWVAPKSNAIEVITLADGRLMLMDEEGKLRDDDELSVNQKATILLQKAGIIGDFVVGDVAILDPSELE